MDFKEKAQEWIEKEHIKCSNDILESLVRLLKEQDRDTRHRCAEMAAKAAETACMNMRFE